MFRFFRKYHYVPPCPKCGSLKTGRFYYVSTTYQQIEKMVAENMRYGELSKIEIGFGNELDHNAYCEECGAQWYTNIEKLPLTDERIQQEMENRGITSKSIKDVSNCRKINKKNKKEEKRELKKQKRLEKKKKKKSSINKNPNKIETTNNIVGEIINENIDTYIEINEEVLQEKQMKDINTKQENEIIEITQETKNNKPQVKPFVKPLPKRKK